MPLFEAGDEDYIEKLNELDEDINGIGAAAAASAAAAAASEAAAAASEAAALAAQSAVEGAGNNPPIRTSLQALASDFTIPAGENGLSVGPVTVNAGVTVTVTSGSTWSVI